MRGPKPKPLSLILLDGNRRKLTRRELEQRRGPEPPRGIPNTPNHLSEGAKIAWPKLAAKLDEIGVLTVVDGWALEQLAENYTEILEWRKEIKDHGRMATKKMQNGEEREYVNPACIALADSEKRFRAMLGEFGLTPSARTRIHVTPPKYKPVNPADKYFRRGMTHE